MKSLVVLIMFVFSFGQAIYFLNLFNKKKITITSMLIQMFFINILFVLLSLQSLGKLFK